MTRQPKIVPRSYFWGWRQVLITGVAIGLVTLALAQSSVIALGIPVIAMATIVRRLGGPEQRWSHTVSHLVLLDVAVLAIVVIVDNPDGGESWLEFGGRWAIVLIASIPLLVLPIAWIGTMVRHVWPIAVANQTPCGHQSCPSCSYSLVGNVSGVCPECGEAVLDTESS